MITGSKWKEHITPAIKELRRHCPWLLCPSPFNQVWRRAKEKYCEPLSKENFLADLYIRGESTFQIEDNGKQKVMSVERAEFYLTDEAVNVFRRIHDEWEIEVCKRNPHDALIGDIFKPDMLTTP
ncbi:hypothetical protein ACROYT_G014386 [Oculina patagonica]